MSRPGPSLLRARLPARHVLRGALVALPLLLAWSSAARAGDYHVGATLRCSDCHVMHFSQSHDYGLGGGLAPGPGFVTLVQGPNPSLLRDRINDLCLACHDGMGQATDVLGPANTGSQAGIIRAAGYLNRLGLDGLAGTGHTLDGFDAAPGSVPGWSPPDENGAGGGLTCTNCHAPHGEPGVGHPTGSQYRNLRSDPGTGSNLWVTTNDTPGVNDLSRDVFVRAARNYDESAMDWNEPDDQDSAIARWCGGCHSFAHGEDLANGGGSTPWGGFLDEHPVWKEDLGGDEIDQYNSHVNRVKVMSEIGFWSPAGRDVTPTCVTCHRSHGNGNPDGLIYRSGSGVASEDGDSNGLSVDDLCGQCHAQSPAFALEGALGG